MTSKTADITIVIPVYNEENYLKSCLDSISVQTIRPAEVLVVDNNSTDRSIEIALQYDFVTVIHETRQHQAFASHSGFNCAKSLIIGRIDADTVLPGDWVKKVIAHFEKQPELVGITGSGYAYDLTFSNLGKRVLDFYFRLGSKIAGNTMMTGNNCAVRKVAWEKVRTKVRLANNVWEDWDLALCLSPLGVVEEVRDIDINFSARLIKKPKNYILHVSRAVRTVAHRSGVFRGTVLTFVWLTQLILAPILAIDQILFFASGKNKKSIPKVVPHS